MARRWIVAGVIVAVFAAGGAAVALLTRDEGADPSSATRGTTTTPPTASGLATTSTTPTSTGAPTAAASTTTTEAPRAALSDPCGAETAAIRAAIENGVDGARDRASIDTCRQAPVDTSWAIVTLVAKAGANFSPISVVLHGGGGSWAVVDSGTANVACGKAPQRVLVDLGIVCTSGGGG
jgi:hypothetical protein